MEAYGIKYDDIKVQYLSFGEAASALKDGNVDAAFVTAGHPTAAIQDIATQNDVVLVPVDADKADALIKQYPFYTKLVIKAGTYPKQDADVSAVAVKCMLAVTDKMDENTAYAIAKALYGNLDRMKSAHSAANAISKDTAKDGMSIKLNPGAEKFFNENKDFNDAELQRPETGVCRWPVFFPSKEFSNYCKRFVNAFGVV